MKKVFIISYGCCPGMQSEKAIGWNYIKKLCRFNRLTVLTRLKNKSVIQSHIKNSKNSDLKNIKWVFYDLNDNFLKIKKYIGVQIYFYLWLNLSYLKFKKYILSQNFDIIHQLNYAVVWLSTPYYRLSNKFIWGPIGGGDIIPLSFLKHERVFNIFREFIYFSIVWISRNLSIQNYYSRNFSRLILFRTSKVAKRFLKSTHVKRKIIMSETGFDAEKIEFTVNDFTKINAITIGRMDYWKATIYAVKGFEKFLKSGGRGKLNIIGDGKDFNKLEKYIFKNNLDKSIILRGKINYESYLKQLKKSNVLLYPSLRDGGSFSVLESMAMGKVIICNNNSGPVEMVSNEAGYIIDSISPSQMISDISTSLFQVINNPKLSSLKGKLSRKRAENFYTWDILSKRMNSIYDDIHLN